MVGSGKRAVKLPALGRLTVGPETTVLAWMRVVLVGHYLPSSVISLFHLSLSFSLVQILSHRAV